MRALSFLLLTALLCSFVGCGQTAGVDPEPVKPGPALPGKAEGQGNTAPMVEM